MLITKRTKYRRPHRIKYEGKAKRWNCSFFLVNMDYKLKEVLDYFKTNRSSSYCFMNRYMKRGGQVWIRIFPHLAKTKKPLEVRMGSGKGAPEEWVAVVKTGRVMFEVAGVEEEVAREALRLASHKLPIKCKIIGRGE